MKYVIMRTKHGFPEFLSIPVHPTLAAHKEDWVSIPADKFNFLAQTFATKFLKTTGGLKVANLKKSDNSVQMIPWPDFIKIIQVHHLLET